MAFQFQDQPGSVAIFGWYSTVKGLKKGATVSVEHFRDIQMTGSGKSESLCFGRKTKGRFFPLFLIQAVRFVFKQVFVVGFTVV